MRTVTMLVAAVLLLAGCSGGSDEASPEPAASADASKGFDRAELEKQAKEQADQVKKAQDDLAERVAGTVNIVIKDGKVSPQGKRVEVKVGQTVTLSITSDVDEEIHVHSEPEHTYEVTAGTPVTESFTVDNPGQVAVEAHELGVTIVQLVVRP